MDITKKPIKIIDYDVSGLKCDNVKCDYRDDNIPLSEYHKNIDAPCPKCGQSLLTMTDYKLTMRIVKSINLINDVANASFARNILNYLDVTKGKISQMDITKIFNMNKK